MRASVIALGLPLLAAGARHAHQHVHRNAHALVDRAIYTEVVTVTEIVTVAVEAVSSTSTMITGVTSTSTNSPSPAPIEDHKVEPTTIANGNRPFQTLVPVANSAIVKNSCEYPVYVWSAGNPTCQGPAANCTMIAPNSTYTETLRRCADGGICLKVSKDTSPAKPMQFEYSVWKDDVNVSYDISYLDCMVNENGEKDLNGCAGHDGGIQAVGGGECPDYHCLAGKWCDQQAYVVAEFDYQPNAPVGGCTVDKGIAFELCAGNRG